MCVRSIGIFWSLTQDWSMNDVTARNRRERKRLFLGTSQSQAVTRSVCYAGRGLHGAAEKPVACSSEGRGGKAPHRASSTAPCKPDSLPHSRPEPTERGCGSPWSPALSFWVHGTPTVFFIWSLPTAHASVKTIIVFYCKLL